MSKHFDPYQPKENFTRIPRISILTEVSRLQTKNSKINDYQRGLSNGLEWARSIIVEDTPNFIPNPDGKTVHA